MTTESRITKPFLASSDTLNKIDTLQEGRPTDTNETDCRLLMRTNAVFELRGGCTPVLVAMSLGVAIPLSWFNQIIAVLVRVLLAGLMFSGPTP